LNSFESQVEVDQFTLIDDYIQPRKSSAKSAEVYREEPVANKSSLHAKAVKW